jgi:hypothetical protein
VRKLVAVFERKELSASFNSRKELLLAAPPHKGPPATEASVAITFEEHGRNMPSPGQLGSPVESSHGYKNARLGCMQC